MAADGAPELVAELAALGAESVAVPACDTTDRDAVAALLAGLTGPRLTAVVHAAGLYDAGVVGEIEPERLARVFAPKVTAAQHLDELTRELVPHLDAFVAYSSVSAVFLGTGTGSYAAANAGMDALLARRRAAGFPAQSLAWGLWGADHRHGGRRRRTRPRPAQPPRRRPRPHTRGGHAAVRRGTAQRPDPARAGQSRPAGPARRRHRRGRRAAAAARTRPRGPAVGAGRRHRGRAAPARRTAGRAAGGEAGGGPAGAGAHPDRRRPRLRRHPPGRRRPGPVRDRLRLA
ncbi:SDR family oxidoreductase [Streptomyces tricolor]|nr:SDR family oxidoreductase [Streptomyces tricolor]